MHRNPYWMLFMILFLLGILGYSTYAFYEVWQYMRLDKQVKAQSIQWSIITASDEAYIPNASYSFKMGGKDYKNYTRLNETYLNEWAAQEAIDRLKQAPPLVWFDSSSPDISTLQKNFPLKASLYAILLWMLGLYFAGLGYYVNRRIF